MTKLPKRQLGRTGLPVTMLGYGAMELRDAPRGREVTNAQAETILHAVLDAGINYIDTSIDYGVSEERIGRYIADRRAEYYLASKCGCLVGAAPAPRGQRNPHVFTRDNILAGVEQSLRRMRTDYLDVVQFHSSPSRKTLEEDGALETVLELKRAGAIRFVGMSGTLPNLSDHIAMGVFDVFQIPYSAVEREHEALLTAAAPYLLAIGFWGYAERGAYLIPIYPLFAAFTAGFVVRLTYTEPDCALTVDLRDRVEWHRGDAGLAPDVEFLMKGDVGHRFWLGKVNLLIALAKRDIKSKGSLNKALKILPRLKPLYPQYPKILEKKGKTQLARA